MDAGTLLVLGFIVVCWALFLLQARRLGHFHRQQGGSFRPRVGRLPLPEMKRSPASRRTLNIATLVGLAASLVAYASFVFFAIETSDPEQNAGAFLPFIAFGAGSVVVFLCSFVFWEDSKTLELPSEEESWMKWLWRLWWVMPPATFALYWWRYVRASAPRQIISQ